jgi:hypothetical protein
MEDGTIQLLEPQVENSGLSQGQFLRRHRIMKPDGSAFQLADLQCGRDIEIYKRIYRIASMDAFTRRFYERANLDPGEELAMPSDPFTERRQAEIENMNKPLPPDVIREKALVNILCGGTQLNRKVKQYLSMDGKILRFYCYWDDDTEDGYRHFFHLHYFLSDDTVEIIEVFEETESCAAARSTFLKRGHAKKGDTKPSIGDNNQQEITPNEIRTNAFLKIVNRRFFVYDCDPFTRTFYHDHFGIDQASVEIPKVVRTVPRLPLPPSTGFGSEEDSLASCGSIVPHKPRIDPSKQLHIGVILRFEAVIKEPRPDLDEYRKFILGFYPTDSSIAVWETPVRNSGIVAGKFAERSCKLNPITGKCYTVKDLTEGGILTVSGVEFVLRKPDEFTCKWLREHVSP